MRGAVNLFTIQPVLNPSCVFNFVINNAFPLLEEGVIHIAFGSRNYQFELLISAVVAVFVGIVIVKVVVEVLSEPKSSTAIDLFPCVTL